MSSPYSPFLASPEQGQSQSQNVRAPIPGSSSAASRGLKTTLPSNSGSASKKGRKSRGSSSAASPATFSNEMQNESARGQSAGPSTIQFAMPSQPASASNSQSSVAQDTLGAESPGIIVNLPSEYAVIAGPSTGSGTVVRGSMSGPGLADDEGDGDEDILPDMADDDYSAQLSWQSQSKDNLKVLMDNFTPEQYDRYEAYRRNALPKQAVRRVIQQSVGHQVSTPVAQVVAGFAKVFVGEMVEKARKIQQERGDVGPLSPDHLREAYREYQEETGRVGAARPLRGKKLFVR